MSVCVCVCVCVCLCVCLMQSMTSIFMNLCVAPHCSVANEALTRKCSCSIGWASERSSGMRARAELKVTELPE